MTGALVGKLEKEELIWLIWSEVLAVCVGVCGYVGGGVHSLLWPQSVLRLRLKHWHRAVF